MPKFLYSSPAQFRQKLRQEFQTATGRRLHKIAAYIDGNFTDAQLKNGFNLTDAQTAALRTKLQNMSARLNAFDTEAGS